MALSLKGETFRHPSVAGYSPEAPWEGDDGQPLIELLGADYAYNPVYDLEPGDMEIVRLWRLAYTGMGVGVLPEAGGALDQPAILMEAFEVMSAAERELKPEKGR